MKNLILLWICLLLAVPCSAEIIYVDADAAGANDGSSWADAYNYLQDALTAAWSGDEIRVAQGIYKPDQGGGIMPGDRYTTFQLIADVTIKGGYAGFTQPDPNARDIALYETILSGDLNSNDVAVTYPEHLLTEPTRAENSYHVVTGSGTDATAVLDGFTLTAGNANGSTSGNQRGGGVWSCQGRPTVTNCTIRRNSAKSLGGGLAECAMVENCIVELNWAGQGGGIFRCGPVRNCVVTHNSAETKGGGLCNCGSITGCAISNNFAGWSGGGLESTWPIHDCIVSGNFAGLNGGGIRGCQDEITNCFIIGNLAGENGGGIYRSSIISNCTITNNRAYADGGGIYCNGNDTTVSNSILWSNTATRGDEIALSGYCVCGGTQCYCYYSSITLSYSDVQTGPTAVHLDYEACTLNWGMGNIDADPLFVYPYNGDYHLKSTAGRWDPSQSDWVIDSTTSPCIDAGNPGCSLGDEPNDVNNIRINMGAYGGTAEASKSPANWALLADLTNDRIVDFDDLAVFVRYWLDSAECIPSDLNHSQSVDFIDFALMALHWLECTSSGFD